MSRNSKASLFVLLLLALVIPFTISSAKTKEAIKYTVSKDSQEIAKLSVSTDRNSTKVTIERQGQSAHTYTKSIVTNDVTVNIGGKEFLVYNNTSGDFQLRNLKDSSYQIENTESNTSQLKWTKNKLTEKSLAIQNLLSDDMKIFRIVRNFDESVKTRSFELAYVILTSDESIYWSKELNGYDVKSSNRRVKNNSTQFVKTSFDGAGCGEGCDSRLASCLQNVPAGDRIECYRIADTCHGRCDKPALEETLVS